MGQEAQFSQAALASAFQTFNQLSDQLAASYHALEQQVSHLNEELNKSNDARLHELTEKERLANRLSILLQALPGGVVVVDGNGKVQEFNQAALDILGEPLQSQPWTEVIQRAFAPRLDDGHDISLQDGRRVNISTCPMVNEPGQVLLITDVTEIRQLQDKVNHQERLVAMGEMAASLAHQIRTPLASAMLYASNLKRTELVEADRERFCEKIQSRLGHLEHIVNDMLLYARSNITGTEESFDVNTLITDVEHTIDAKLVESSVFFQYIDETANATLQGNRQMILSAMTNLCVNAIQAMKGNGNLSIITRYADSQHIEVMVCDDGPGIPEEKLKRIFEPFFTTRSEGTGLGLAVVRAIIHAHKGEVLIDSQTGKGTTFILRLPLVKSDKSRPDPEIPVSGLMVNAG